MTQEEGSGSTALNLSIPPAEEIASRVQEETDPEPAMADPALIEHAEAFVEQALAAAQQDAPDHQPRQAVDEMGLEVQRQAAHRSEMLQGPIRQLAHQGDDGGPVASSLTELRNRMEQLDPQRHTLTASGLPGALSRLPGVSSPLQRYFRKFETAQEALDATIKDLKAGKDRLHRDNLTLSDDQQSLRESLEQLRRQIALGRLIDHRLQERAGELPEGDESRRYIEAELLFPLRQRVVDLQQQLAVSQQAILSLEVVIRNNRELMRGVDRAINVTASALNVAVTVALALANQRLVLDRVEALNATTSQLIAGTSRNLRTQGAQIQDRASSSMLDIERLEQAFEDVIGAIDEVTRYRRESLPVLDTQIERLDTLTAQGQAALGRLERGSRGETGADS